MHGAKAFPRGGRCLVDFHESSPSHVCLCALWRNRVLKVCRRVVINPSHPSDSRHRDRIESKPKFYQLMVSWMGESGSFCLVCLQHEHWGPGESILKKSSRHIKEQGHDKGKHSIFLRWGAVIPVAGNLASLTLGRGGSLVMGERTNETWTLSSSYT